MGSCPRASARRCRITGGSVESRLHDRCYACPFIAAAALMTRFFHDVVPWWHLISPAFVIFVVLPLLYWSTTKRGDWSGWNGLAQSYGVDAWPGDASDLGAPRYCRIRRRDGCAPQKFDQQLRVAASPTSLCLRVECCATGMMRPLAVPWRAVRDDGVQSTCGIPLGQLALGDDVFVTLDGAIHAGVLAAKGRLGTTV